VVLYSGKPSHSDQLQTSDRILLTGMPPDRWDNDYFNKEKGRSNMSAQSISNTSANNRSGDAMGTLLMIALAIIAAIPIVIGFWASQTGGAL
jgi:hypothetical protein